MEIGKIFELLGNTDVLQSLIKAENQIDNDDNSLEFENENGHLKINITDNGIQMSYSYEEGEDESLRDDFVELCDSLDDEFFDEVCEDYTAVYGEGSLNELNKNMTKQGVRQFMATAKDLANEKLAKYASYRNAISNFVNGL